VTEEAVLSPAREALVRVAAALGTRRQEPLREALQGAARSATPAAVEEVLLQSHLFVGFPDALEAMVLWREVGGSPAPAPYPEEAELWAARGPSVCARVYGANYGKLRRNVTALHPDLDRWMVEGGYGRVIGRPGLDLATRELCIAALLVAWRAPRQLHSHLRGSLNAGAEAGEVSRAVEIACGYAAAEAATEARDLLARVLSRATTAGDGEQITTGGAGADGA
jgi:4-carboxymuconolactone decarboxylase